MFKSFEEFLTEKSLMGKPIKERPDMPELEDALFQEDYDRMIELLAQGANPDYMVKKDNDEPLIFLAIKYGDRKAFDILIEYGAYIEIKDPSFHKTPLAYACGRRDKEYFVNKLLQLGVNPNAESKIGQTPLESIASYLLMSVGNSSIDYVDNAYQYIRSLLHYGAKCTDKFQQTMKKFSEKHPEIYNGHMFHDLLKNRCDMNIIEKSLMGKPIKPRELYQDIKFVHHIDMGYAKPTELRQALQDGFDPNSMNNHGLPIISILAKDRGDVELLKILIAYGADIEKVSESGYTPLMMASMFGNADAVKFLLDNGANMSTKIKGKTAFTVSNNDYIRSIFLNRADVMGINRKDLI